MKLKLYRVLSLCPFLTFASCTPSTPTTAIRSVCIWNWDIAFLKYIFMRCTYVNAWRAHSRSHKHYVDLTESHIYRGWQRDIRWVRAVRHKNWTLLCSAVPWLCSFIHILHIFVVCIELTNTRAHFRICSYLTFISALDIFIVAFLCTQNVSHRWWVFNTCAFHIPFTWAARSHAFGT